jgi:hypothetical protein
MVLHLSARHLLPGRATIGRFLVGGFVIGNWDADPKDGLGLRGLLKMVVRVGEYELASSH